MKSQLFANSGLAVPGLTRLADAASLGLLCLAYAALLALGFEFSAERPALWWPLPALGLALVWRGGLAMAGLLALMLAVPGWLNPALPLPTLALAQVLLAWPLCRALRHLNVDRALDSSAGLLRFAVLALLLYPLAAAVLHQTALVALRSPATPATWMAGLDDLAVLASSLAAGTPLLWGMLPGAEPRPAPWRRPITPHAALLLLAFVLAWGLSALASANLLPGGWPLALAAASLPLLSRAEQLRSQKERRQWRGKLEATGLALAQWSPGQEFNASPAWQALLGRGQAASPLAWLDQVHALDRMTLEEQLPSLLDSERRELLRQPVRLSGEDGWQWHELRLQVVQRDPRGRASRVLASLQDIQWRRTAEERQRMSTGLFQHLHEGLAITDAQFRLLDANPAYWALMQTLLQPPGADLLLEEDGRPHADPEALRARLLGQVALPLDEALLRHGGHDPAAIADALQRDQHAGHWQGLVQLRGEGGQPRTLRVTLSSIPEPEGPPRHRVLALTDLTQELRQQQALERLARFDELTDLPNEPEFVRRLQRALHASQQVGPGLMLCVARLDLDGFAAFNRSQGAERADQALRELARRLGTALRQAPEWPDEVARLGGDEFALLLRVQNPEEAQLALDRLLQVLRQPLPLPDASSAPPDVGTGSAPPRDGASVLRLSASVGATLYPQDGGSAETLLRHAAHALYRVKRSGRDGVQFFDPEKRRQHEAQAQALGRVQQALDAGELCLYYQPQLDLADGRLLGVEALLRWRHPQRGLLSPAAFLPTVERSGMAAQLGYWVLEQALDQATEWRHQGLDLELSVNISPRHLQAPDFCARLEALLARHPDVPPGRVVLELLESSALDDLDAAQALLEECRRMGLRLAMDDFGTGYATLSVLKRLPLDQLKIDRSFVQTMLVDSADQALVQGVIALAQRFNCELVAEGVESPAHAQALLAAGCGVGQGSGLCDPLPPAELLRWARERQVLPPAAPPAAQQA